MHAHISGLAIFLTLFFIFGFGALILAFIADGRERRYAEQLRQERMRLDAQRDHTPPGVTREGRWNAPYRDGGVIYSSPVVSPVAYPIYPVIDPYAGLAVTALAEAAIIQDSMIGGGYVDSGIDIGGGYDGGGYSDGGIDFDL